jgi:serine/threonine-protein kinase BUR1
LKDVFVSIDGPHYYMVFEYVEHDLYGLLKAKVPFTEDQVRSLMRQLLNALKVLHGLKILHRDLKTSNLLITQKGVLKLADFGLSRFQLNKSKYTNCVITRWYRPPELLLGATEYTSKIDMWSVGCILGEFMLREEILPGQSEFDQLDLIWKTCGSPTQESWSNAFSLPQWQQCKPDKNYPRRVRERFRQSNFSPEAIDLLDKLLVLDPEKRLSAEECLAHPWFQKGNGMEIPMNLPSHRCDELEFKKRRERGAHLPPPLSHNPHISYHEAQRPDPSDMPPTKKMKTSHPSSGPRGPPFKGSISAGVPRPGNVHSTPGEGPPVVDSNLPLPATRYYGNTGVPPYHPHASLSGKYGRGAPYHGRDDSSTFRMGRGPPGPDGTSSNPSEQHYQRYDQRVDADGGRSGYHRGGERPYRHGLGRGGGSAAGTGADRKYPGDGTYDQRPYYSSHHRPDGRYSHAPPFQHQSDHSGSGNNNGYHSKPAPSSSQQHHSSSRHYSLSGQPERKRRDSNGHTTNSNGTGQSSKD